MLSRPPRWQSAGRSYFSRSFPERNSATLGIRVASRDGRRICFVDSACYATGGTIGRRFAVRMVMSQIRLRQLKGIEHHAYCHWYTYATALRQRTPAMI